jgi:SAM-dependent methyltransferase
VSAGWLRRWIRSPWLVRLYPARFRTLHHQHLNELTDWFRDQVDSESRAFDRNYGVSTSWFDLDNYEPTPPSVVRDVLDRLDPTDRTFVDMGSGKGRAVLLAAERSFREVVGVEHRWFLHWRAQRNVANCKVPLVAPVRLVQSDAARWAFPDGPAVIFMYNPFPEHILRAVLRNVRHPDTLLAYVNPLHEGAVLAAGWEELARQDHPAQDRCWRLYAKDPGASRARRAGRVTGPG